MSDKHLQLKNATKNVAPGKENESMNSAKLVKRDGGNLQKGLYSLSSSAQSPRLNPPPLWTVEGSKD